MKIVVIGNVAKDLQEELRRHGIKVVWMPTELAVYKFDHRTGYQEFYGDAAVQYLKSLLER